MMMKNTVVALMGLAVAAEAGNVHRAEALFGRQNKNGASKASANTAASTCLNANAIQTGSQITGQVNGVAADGQVNSATDGANFINFCSGLVLTNGVQNLDGSCNGVVMGKIPALAKTVSTVITFPGIGDTIVEKTDFNVSLTIANMVLGHFTNATSTYYSAPQDLDANGLTIGHTHVTIQDAGSSLNPKVPLDATQFVFFKGINDAGDGKGHLTTPVAGGLPAGNYRICTMAGASNHQPVLSPKAQRGAQDDCKYFVVTPAAGGAGGANNAAGGKAASSAAVAASTAKAVAASTAKAAAASTDKAAATTTAKAAASTTAKAATAATTTKAAAGGTNNAATGGSAGAIGGIAAPAVENSGDTTRPFKVGSDTFVNKSAAVQRACAQQNNACANAVNSGKIAGGSVAACNAQETACNAAGGA